ncbi:MAG TPA: peptidoglycan-binding domain-containing protein [Chthoniobacterales bacterium]|nr:peptidoglycan-binding domain-containing protein [Chthoniobacterales bacterium]
MKLRIAIFILLTSVGPLWADQPIENVQQALKDQGFYYGEITGTKDADTTAAIRRYQIRNGLQITGDLNEETLKSLGVDSSSARAIAKASPSPVPTAPDTSDLRTERHESAAPTNPLTGQPFPESPQDRQAPVRPDYGAVPGQPAENFAGTPYEAAPPQVQRDVIISAQNILARRGLYRGAIDGQGGSDLEFSLRAYQARVRLPITGRLDLETLAALELLPGANAPVYVPRRRPWRKAPVRGEWIPDR